jgi:hypothetical protein
MTQPTYVSVPVVLQRGRNINAYTEDGYLQKEAFHKQGVAFLRKLAKSLGLPPGTFDVRSNKGGMAVSGEITLHSDDLYLQLSESCIGPGVQALYRTCDGRKDYCGHQNRFAKMAEFSGSENQARMVAQLRALISSERNRKLQNSRRSAEIMAT